MRLWTIQSEEVYEQISSEGIYHCGGSGELPMFGAPYRWMAEQMAARIGPPPDGAVFPIWAWHTMYWEHRRPDMRRMEFRRQSRPFALMEIEIPDRDVLLSDEESWHFVLGDNYFCDAANETEFDAACRRYDSLPEAAQRAVKERSWEKIFTVFPQTDNGWRRIGCFIQATFWELRGEQLVKVWHYA